MNALESLDTLIAFVTILTICSIFVLIVVQMVSAALSLRGKNMANALALTFQTVAPELKGQAHALAQRILTNPALSDSMWKAKDNETPGDSNREKEWKAWWPYVSGKAVKLANAIRPEEVLAALQKLKELKPSSDKQAMIDAGNAAGATDEAKRKGAVALKEWTDSADKKMCDAASKLLSAAGVPDVVAKEKLSAVLTVVNTVGDAALKQNLMTAVSEASGKLADVIQTVEGQLTGWLNSAQDRAQQWFQAHVRNVTLAASILFAFICQIDAVDLFRHVSTDAKAREALVSASAKIVEEGGDVLDEKGGLPARVAEAWNKGQPSLKIELSPSWQRVDEVRIEAQKKTPPPQPNFDTAFATAEKTATKAYFEDKEKRLKGLKETFKATGFDIFPDGGRRWNKEGTGCILCDPHYRNHFPGMLLFAGLLSLGAPYWFNLLKNLSSLRPALAKLIGEEQKAETSGAKS